MPDTIKQDNRTNTMISTKNEPFRLYKFGIMVNSLDLSQKSFYIVKHLNNTVDQDCQFSPIVFYKEYAKGIDVNRFCTLLEKECWGYDGVVLATSLETAETLLHCPCPVKKLFYVWDLDWLYNTYTYPYLQAIYQSDLELIARNKYHATVLEKCWKKPRYLMDNFDPAILTQIVKENFKGESNV